MSHISEHLVKACVEVGIPPGTQNSHWIGTGILYAHPFLSFVDNSGRGSLPFLFTNKHILEDLLTSNKADKVAIRLLNRETGKSEIRTSDLFDSDTKEKLWVIHPNVEVDVAVISLGNPAKALQFTLAEPGQIMNLQFMKKEGMQEGDFVYMVGYPYSLKGVMKQSRAYPVVRSGCIARIADAYHGESQTYLIDVTSFPGNSGGAVISKATKLDEHLKGTFGTNKSGLIGMVSGYLEFDDEAISIQSKRPRVVFTENSGLTVVQTVDNMIQALQILLEQMHDLMPKGNLPLAEK